MDEQKQMNYMYEDVEHQQNLAIPADAKRVSQDKNGAVNHDIFVWPCGSNLAGSGGDSNGFYAVRPNFVNLQESVCGIGDTPDEAIAYLLDAELDATLSNKPETAEDSSDDEKQQSTDVGGGSEADAAEGNTELPTLITDWHKSCDADHKNCEAVGNCKEHHKRDAEQRVAQQ